MINKNQKTVIFRLLYLVFFVLLIVALLSLTKDFKSSVDLIKHSNKSFLFLILLFSFSNFAVAAYSYKKLSFHPQKLIKSTIVQFAANTMNRILPAGIGALGTLYDFLVKSKNTKTQALALVAINNILGLIAGVLTLLFLVVIGNFSTISKLHLNLSKLLYVLLGLALYILINYVLYKKVKRINSFFKDLVKQLASFKDRKVNLALAFLAQIFLNVSNILCLYFTTRALGLHINIAEVGLSYNFAILLGNIIPAPGGVGSVDAGLVAILVLLGSSLAHAVSISILFRVLNMWVPFIVGLPAIFYARKKKYI
jgi:uncharacterized protein (TIRG00374 family)